MITLNGNQPPQQPTGLNENPETIKTDTHSINGSRQRNQSDSKKRAVLAYDFALPATVQFYQALFDAAGPVAYFNDQSNKAGGTHTFTGIIDYDEGDYERGGSLGVSLTVTLREE